MTIVHTLLGVATAKDWEVQQMDVHNALLHGDFEEEVYMKLTPSFKLSDPSKVCSLRKLLYGLKHAHRCSNSSLNFLLLSTNWVSPRVIKTINYLFSLIQGEHVLHVLGYVDDFIVACNNLHAIKKFKVQLNKCLHMKGMGKLKYFFGH